METPVGQTCAMPPSTNTSLPVMKPLSSEARKSATAAVSSGRESNATENSTTGRFAPQ